MSATSAREYGQSNGQPRDTEVRMTGRRDPLAVNTQGVVCRFSYASGTADIVRT